MSSSIVTVNYRFYALILHVPAQDVVYSLLPLFKNKIADYCRPEPPCAAANDPVVKAIMDCCDRLYHLIRQWNSEHSSSSGAGATTSSSSSSSGGQEAGPWGGGGEGEEEVHASGCVPSDVRQLIVSWLSNRRMVGAIIDLWCHAASQLYSCSAVLLAN